MKSTILTLASALLATGVAQAATPMHTANSREKRAITALGKVQPNPGFQHANKGDLKWDTAKLRRQKLPNPTKPRPA